MCDWSKSTSPTNLYTPWRQWLCLFCFWTFSIAPDPQKTANICRIEACLNKWREEGRRKEKREDLDYISCHKLAVWSQSSLFWASVSSLWKDWIRWYLRFSAPWFYGSIVLKLNPVSHYICSFTQLCLLSRCNTFHSFILNFWPLQIQCKLNFILIHKVQ